MKKDAVVLLTDFINSDLLNKYYRIKKDFNGDTFLLFHNEDNIVIDIPGDVNCVTFNLDKLNDLGYEAICETLIPGSCHFALLWFYNNYPDYRFYWNIEDDVDFSGDWKILFDEFFNCDSDFLSTHINEYRDSPNWFWWNTLKCNDSIPLEKRIRSFNPIYRISEKALCFLDVFLKDLNMGHHEVLIPTALFHNNFSINDFGGDGKYVLENHTNKFYLPDSSNLIQGGTMRYRPVFPLSILDQIKNKLIHPIKLKESDRFYYDSK